MSAEETAAAAAAEMEEEEEEDTDMDDDSFAELAEVISSAPAAVAPPVYESATLAQPPKLEVIAEHKIWETPAPSTALSPTAFDQTDQEVESFAVGGVSAGGYGSETTFSLNEFAGEFDDQRSETPLSRQDSYSHSRRNSFLSFSNAPERSVVNDAAHPLLRPIAVSHHPSSHLSEPVLPKNRTEPAGLSGVFRQVGHFVGRHIFGGSLSVTATPSDSVQSLVFGTAPPARSVSHQRIVGRRAYSSRNSISSDASALPTSRSVAGSIKGGLRPKRSTASTGRDERVFRGRLLRSAGGAFQQSKGTSAITLRNPTIGLPSPCGECPHCRKFRTDSERAVFLGARCNCRVCAIISENAFGARPLLRGSSAPRRDKTPTDSQPVSRMPSDFGIFCEHCYQSSFVSTDGRCSRFSLQPTVVVTSAAPAADDARGESNFSSVDSLFVGAGGNRGSRDHSILQVCQQSLTSISTSGGPLCRICHTTGGFDCKDETLMAPCRCTGTLKFVHMSCLIHWLEISRRKLRKPPVCELCGFRYVRQKHLTLRNCAWPPLSTADKFYHCLFGFAIALMFLCGLATIFCFRAEKHGVYGSNLRQRGQNVELTAVEVVTLVAGILFFVGFFVAMYAQVKAHTSIYKYCCRFWALNHEWRVSEYSPERDADYARRLRERRDRLQPSVPVAEPLAETAQA